MEKDTNIGICRDSSKILKISVPTTLRTFHGYIIVVAWFL